MGRKMKITGGFKATPSDMERIIDIQNLLGVSRAKAVRSAIEKLYEEEKNLDNDRIEVHFFHDEQLKRKIEFLENKLKLNKSSIYRLAIRWF